MDEGGLLYWVTLRYVQQGSEMGVYFHWGPLLGNMDGRFFLGAFLLEEFLLGPLEICKMPCRRVSQ